MPGRRLAQMAAALKTCIILHEAGELDDRLQPVGKELIKYDDEDCEWEEHELHGQARPGTTKRKQYYNKKVICSFMILLMYKLWQLFMLLTVSCSLLKSVVVSSVCLISVILLGDSVQLCF